LSEPTNRTPRPSEEQRVEALVTTEGHDEESRLKLEKLRLEIDETRHKVEKLGLEITGLRHGAWLEWAKAASGPVAVLGLIVSVVLGQLQLRTATETRLEDRFQKEVAHLGSSSSGERLTGVAGLSLILADPSEMQRHREAVSFLVNALAVEQDAVVRGALVSALAQLDPKDPRQGSLVAVALSLLVDRNRVLTGLHEFSAAELTREGIEKSAGVGPIVATGKVLAGLIQRGARVKGVSLAAIACIACDFSGPAVDLSGVDLSSSVLADADFSYAHLEGATLTDALLTGTQFFGAHLRAAQLGVTGVLGVGDASSRYRRLRDQSALNYYKYALDEINESLFPDFSCADLHDAQFEGRVLLGIEQGENEGLVDDAAKFEEANLEGADLMKFRLLYIDNTPGHYFFDESFGPRWQTWGATWQNCGSLPPSRAEDKGAVFCFVGQGLQLQKKAEDRFAELARGLARAKNVGKAKLGKEMALEVQKEAPREAHRNASVLNCMPEHTRP
jgi:uncharacterized protein YjbI with pentapeptide repeats